MELKKVISKTNLPMRSPISNIVLYVLAMDYWNAPGWLWGALGLILLLMLIGWIWGMFLNEEVDIMSQWKGRSEIEKST